jgi:hypothetical protein
VPAIVALGRTSQRRRKPHRNRLVQPGPETSPADATDTAKFKGKGSSLAEEGASHAAIIVVEADLSCGTHKPGPKSPRK